MTNVQKTKNCLQIMIGSMKKNEVIDYIGKVIKLAEEIIVKYDANYIQCCRYNINMIGNNICYCWVTKYQVFYVLTGRFPNGNQLIEWINDTTKICKNLPREWGDIEEINYEKYSVKLNPIITFPIYTKSFTPTISAAQIPLDFKESDQIESNILYCNTKLHKDIKLETLVKLFLPYCTKGSIIVSITKNRNAYINFTGNCYDSHYALLMMNKYYHSETKTILYFDYAIKN